MKKKSLISRYTLIHICTDLCMTLTIQNEFACGLGMERAAYRTYGDMLKTLEGFEKMVKKREMGICKDIRTIKAAPFDSYSFIWIKVKRLKLLHTKCGYHLSERLTNDRIYFLTGE